jgi:hypothetical protein
MIGPEMKPAGSKQQRAGRGGQRDVPNGPKDDHTSVIGHRVT